MVLEPSAGTSSPAIWPRALGARVVCNEIDPRRGELLNSIPGFETFAVDTEIIDDVLPQEIDRMQRNFEPMRKQVED